LILSSCCNWQGIDGARSEKVLDLASITLNKNAVPGKFVA
jgi:glycine/serine hydroxymethyltransferase